MKGENKKGKSAGQVGEIGGFYCLLVVLIWLRFCDCGAMMVVVKLIKINYDVIRCLLFIIFKRYYI